MQVRKSRLALAAGIAAMVVLSSPAFADIWWETDAGTMYWADSVGGAAVFTFDDTGAMFVDGIDSEYQAGRMYDANSGWIESWSGSFTGFWFDYEGTDTPCGQARRDGYGNVYAAWGRVEITFTDLRHFSLYLGQCDGPMEYVINGTPGRLPEASPQIESEPQQTQQPQDTQQAAGNDFAGTLVSLHNQYRQRHCAKPVAWSEQVANSARQWAQTLQSRSCAMEHSGGPVTENLAGVDNNNPDLGGAVAAWYNEVDLYDWSNPDRANSDQNYYFTVGHFMNVVWKGTSEIGCALALCPGRSDWGVLICQYSQTTGQDWSNAGNVQDCR